ncbi:hypothetical protein REPUB_Repub13aG0206900 [Reevesia pubescens]
MDSFEMIGSSAKLKKESEDINNMMDYLYQEAGFTLLEEPESSMVFTDEDHIIKIKEFQAYFDMLGMSRMKKMVKPGYSQEVLKVALNSMSSLVSILTYMSSSPKLHSSL